MYHTSYIIQFFSFWTWFPTKDSPKWSMHMLSLNIAPWSDLDLGRRRVRCVKSSDGKPHRIGIQVEGIGKLLDIYIYMHIYIYMEQYNYGNVREKPSISGIQYSGQWIPMTLDYHSARSWYHWSWPIQSIYGFSWVPLLHLRWSKLTPIQSIKMLQFRNLHMSVYIR